MTDVVKIIARDEAEKARVEGIEIGIEKGIEKGKLEGKLDVARAMMRDGESVDRIVK